MTTHSCMGVCLERGQGGHATLGGVHEATEALSEPPTELVTTLYSLSLPSVHRIRFYQKKTSLSLVALATDQLTLNGRKLWSSHCKFSKAAIS